MFCCILLKDFEGVVDLAMENIEVSDYSGEHES
jgi:hypothetical protein